MKISNKLCESTESANAVKGESVGGDTTRRKVVQDPPNNMNRRCTPNVRFSCLPYNCSWGLGGVLHIYQCSEPPNKSTRPHEVLRTLLGDIYTGIQMNIACKAQPQQLALVGSTRILVYI